MSYFQDDRPVYEAVSAVVTAWRIGEEDEIREILSDHLPEDIVFCMAALVWAAMTFAADDPDALWRTIAFGMNGCD